MIVHILIVEIQDIIGHGICVPGRTLRVYLHRFQIVVDGTLPVPKLAESVPDANGIYFVPAFTGLGAPYWKPDARGVLTGLTRGTGRAQIIRAGVESIAYQVTELVNLMTDDTGIKAGQMKVDGGVCASTFLMQLQSDLLGVTLTRALSDEMTAMGAGLAAGIQAGIFESIEATSKFYKAGASYEPKMSAFEVSEKMEGYRSAVRATLLSGND